MMPIDGFKATAFKVQSTWASLWWRRCSLVVAYGSARPVRIPIWPVDWAPLVAGIYHIALRGFAASIGSVVSMRVMWTPTAGAK
jgi:hypothetical protein